MANLLIRIHCANKRIPQYKCTLTHTYARACRSKQQQKQIQTRAHTIRTKYICQVFNGCIMCAAEECEGEATKPKHNSSANCVETDVQHFSSLFFSIEQGWHDRHLCGSNDGRQPNHLSVLWNCANQQTKQSKTFQDENLRKQKSNRQHTHEHRDGIACMQKPTTKLFSHRKKGNFAQTLYNDE